MKKSILKFIILIIATCLCSIVIFYHVERAKEVTKTEDILITQANLESEFLSNTNYTLDNPKIVVNPYGISPLTALVIFKTNDLTAPEVTIKGKNENSTFKNSFKPSKEHILPIYGLYPDYENEITITVNEHDYKFKIKTDPLPKDFVLPTDVTAIQDKLNNDLYFVTPSSVGYTAAYDVNGDVRWYLTDNFIWDIKRLNNGHLLLSSNRLVNEPYYTTGLTEMDLLGKIYYEYSIPGGYHHDALELPNGNLLVASDDFDNNTVEDYIVEIDRTNGEIVKKIDLKDIIPTKNTGNENYTEYDWFHNNSIWYDAKTNSITLSGRHQDAIINIDYNSLELNWIIGDSSNWDKSYKQYFFKPIGDLEWQWSQHAVSILDNGNIFLFDNGNNRSKNKNDYINANDNYSRGVIYKINTHEMSIEQVWQYGKERGSKYYSPYISNTQYIDKSHYLVHSGGHVETKDGVSNQPAGFTENAKMTSYTTEILNDEVIFEMVLPSNYYRAKKMSLYSNEVYTKGAGVRLGNMGETKTNEKNPSILFNKDADEIIKKYNIEITKEPDRLVVKGTFKKSDEVQIILDNIFKNKTYNMVISNKPYTALCVDLNKKNKGKKINAYKYINDVGLNGKYYIYMKINGKVYDLDRYIEIK